MTTTTNAPVPAQLLTVPQVCQTLQVPKSTLYAWWARGEGPARLKLPNAGARVRPEALREFILELEMSA